MVTKTMAVQQKTAVSPKALKVAYVMQNVGVDLASDLGQVILIRHTVQELMARGHDVDVITLNGRDVLGIDDIHYPKETWQAKQGVAGTRPFRWLESAIRRLQRETKFPYLALFDSFRFYQATRRALAHYDICHEYAGLLSVGAAYACKKSGKPYVITADADLLLEHAVAGEPLHGIQQKMARWAAKTNYRLADKIICVSEPARKSLVNHWDVDPAKIEVIPNGVDVALFSQPVDKTAVRRQWHIAPNVPVIMFVGGFQPWHGIDVLVNSFADLLVSFPDAQLLLVGDGPARENIEALVQSRQLSSNVHMTGRIPHAYIPSLLAIADVVTIPYPRLPRELWFSPLKLYEYMAAGKAIVASRAGQIGEVLVDRQNGLLVEPGDEDALTEAIVTLLRHPELRAKLGLRAQQQAKTEHSWGRQVERLEAVYWEIVG